MVNMINNRNFIHWGLWGGFLVLSNIQTWWSSSFKPAQRASTVSATKELFTPIDPETKKIISKYGLNTKASLELSSIIECGYKHTNIKDTSICINTATIKYSTAFICETASMSMAPSFVTKPSCFAVGTMSSIAYKAHMKGQSIQFSDIALTTIATGARELEHWLPQELVAYGIPFEYTFYVTTFIEGAISTAYTYYFNDTELQKPIMQQNVCPAPLNAKIEMNKTEVSASQIDYSFTAEEAMCSNEKCSAAYLFHESEYNTEEDTLLQPSIMQENYTQICSHNNTQCVGACGTYM